jgi:hypothetical protein
MQSIRYSCWILMERKFSPPILEKYPHTKFHENPFTDSRAVPCGWTDNTDKYDEANRHFTQSCQRAFKKRTVYPILTIWRLTATLVVVPHL